MRRVLPLLLLAACADPQHLVDQATPPIRAVNGGSAEMLVTACPSKANLAATEYALRNIIITLETAGLLVNGNGGTARLELDLCGDPAQ